ncbi:MAG: DUF3137 domain-containing protein [Alphaproteobacteria bacterium]|nr:DUF3137 domain-containing protein [Alphaproteobacteria bacterium]
MQDDNIGLAVLKQKFLAYYNEKLLKRYAALEILRKALLKRFLLRLAFFVGVALAYLVWVLASALPLEDIFSLKMCFCHALYCVIAFYVCILPVWHYKTLTKSLVMKQTLSFWGEQESEGRNVLISEDVIISSGLIGEGYHIFERDDEFCIANDNVNITVSEVYIYQNETKIFFKGVMILLDFNKKFSGKTICRDKAIMTAFEGKALLVLVVGVPLFFLFGGMKFYLFGVFVFFNVVALYLIGSLLLQKLKSSRGINGGNVLLEDVLFAKKWNVTATDQIEARYILTPILMEQMLKIKKKFHGKALDFSFFDNKLLIAVHTDKDFFETTSLFVEATSYRQMEEIIEQIYMICSVADLVK